MLWAILEQDSYRQICEKNRNKPLANEVFSQRMEKDLDQRADDVDFGPSSVPDG